MKTALRCINLTRSEVEYLRTTGMLTRSLLKHLEDIQWRSHVAGTLEIPAAVAEEFREAFGEQLAKAGFDEAYEINAEGRILEDLIDRFYK